jgi:hypothetical protein
MTATEERLYQDARRQVRRVGDLLRATRSFRLKRLGPKGEGARVVTLAEIARGKREAS